jgi:hypothetical protein
VLPPTQFEEEEEEEISADEPDRETDVTDASEKEIISVLGSAETNAQDSVPEQIAPRSTWELSISESIAQDAGGHEASPATPELETPPPFLPPVGKWVSKCESMSDETMESASEEQELAPSAVRPRLDVSSALQLVVLEVPIGEADLEELVDAIDTDGLVRRFPMTSATSDIEESILEEEDPEILSEESVSAEDTGVQATFRRAIASGNSEEEVPGRDVGTDARVGPAPLSLWR